jgi:hypothetical protein
MKQREKKMRKLIITTLLGASSGSAQASTPAAWGAMNLRVNRACVAMSGLSRPELLSKKISFSDVIGTEVRMIRGTDKRGRMQRLLCGYNRSTGRTEIQPADAWNGPTTKP